MTDWQERPDPYLEALRRAPEAPHRNTWTGKPCTCPWGRRRAQTRRTAGQQVNKLLKAPDKAFKTPEGQAFREALARLIERHPDADALAPFIAQRWKKGEIDHEGDRFFDESGQLEAPGGASSVIDNWAQWYHARQHPSRRGVNIMDPHFTVRDLRNKVNEHQAALERERAVKEDLSHGDVVHKFDNGWHVRHLTAPGTDTSEALYQEGRHMGHCIGDHSQNYQELARQGLIDVYSLRDPKGFPHGTWHTNPSGTIAEVHGNADRALSPEQDAMYEEWCQANGFNPEPYGNEGDPYDQEVRLRNPEDIYDYLAQYSDESDWSEQYPDDANIGEETEIYLGDPDFHSIGSDYYFGQNPDVRAYRHDQRDHESLFNAALQSGHLDQLHNAITNYPIDEPWEQQALDKWQGMYNQHVHPLTGQFTHPTWNSQQGRWQPITELFQPRLMEPDWSNSQDYPWSQQYPPDRQNAWENTPGWTYSRRKAHVPEDHKHRDTDLYSATDYLEDNRYRRRATS